MPSGKVRAYVCPVTGHESEISTIKGMIVAAGGELVCDDKGDLTEWEECVVNCDVVVILICQATVGNPEIEAVIETAGRLGKRVVGIWLNEQQNEGIPAALDREADAVITASEESIKKAIIQKEQIWTLPSGEKRPTQKTPRHKGH